MAKGEIAHYEQFLLFQHCFQKACSPGASKGVIMWEWVKLKIFCRDLLDDTTCKIWYPKSLCFRHEDFWRFSIFFSFWSCQWGQFSSWACNVKSFCIIQPSTRWSYIICHIGQEHLTEISVLWPWQPEFLYDSNTMSFWSVPCQVHFSEVSIESDE